MTEYPGGAARFTPFADGLDYADPRHWFRTSDGASRGAADVFVLAPTVVFDPAKPVYDAVDDPDFLAGLAEFDQIAVSPVFDGLDLNLHYPAYRQVNGGRLLDVPDPMGRFWDPQTGPGPAVRDVFNAFGHFLAQRDPEAPFVLFSHSQGSILASALLTRFIPAFLDARERSRLAVAYLIGWGLTEGLLSRTGYPASTSPTDRGAIVSWNTATASEVASAERATWGDATTRAVNPITFDTTTEHVPAARNPFSVLRHSDEPAARRLPHLTGARLVVPASEGGRFKGQVVEVDLDEHSFRSEAEIAAQDASSLGYTHHWDISLFAGALRENLRQRLGVGLRG